MDVMEFAMASRRPRAIASRQDDTLERSIVVLGSGAQDEGRLHRIVSLPRSCTLSARVAGMCHAAS